MTSCVALCSFEGSLERSRKASGGHGEGETPLPIPNRAVKPLSADGTWLARARESRSPPVLLDAGEPHESGARGICGKPRRRRDLLGPGGSLAFAASLPPSVSGGVCAPDRAASPGAAE